MCQNLLIQPTPIQETSTTVKVAATVCCKCGHHEVQDLYRQAIGSLVAKQQQTQNPSTCHKKHKMYALGLGYNRCQQHAEVWLPNASFSNYEFR